MMGKIGGKVYAVVGHARLFAKNGDGKLAGRRLFQQFFNQPVAYHAVANDDESGAHICLTMQCNAATIARPTSGLLMYIKALFKYSFMGMLLIFWVLL
jgi:hypothetical protein